MATGSPTVISPQLTNSKGRENFPIFPWQKSRREDLDRPSQGQMPTHEPITCFAWAQSDQEGASTLPWDQGGGSKSFGSFPKEKPAVFAKWKGIGHWVIKTRSATINSTVLISCSISYKHAVSWPRRSLASLPALIHITKQYAVKRKREISKTNIN